MEASIEKYLTQLKSKPIADYSLVELQEEVDHIYNLYEDKNIDKPTKKVLQSVYYKIMQHYNERAGKKIYSQEL